MHRLAPIPFGVRRTQQVDRGLQLPVENMGGCLTGSDWEPGTRVGVTPLHWLFQGWQRVRASSGEDASW